MLSRGEGKDSRFRSRRGFPISHNRWKRCLFILLLLLLFPLILQRLSILPLLRPILLRAHHTCRTTNHHPRRSSRSHPPRIIRAMPRQRFSLRCCCCCCAGEERILARWQGRCLCWGSCLRDEGFGTGVCLPRALGRRRHDYGW